MKTPDASLLTRPKVWGPALLVVVVAIAWWFAWMRPESSKLASVRRQETEQRALQASLTAELMTLRAEAKQVHRASPFLDRFAKAIPAAPDSPEIVVQVYDLSVQDNVTLQSITDNTIDPTTSGYSTIPVSLSVSGGHDSLLAFLAGLYHLPRLLTVQSVSLSGKGSILSSGQESYSASIGATAYTTYVPSAAGTATVAAPTTAPPSTS